MSTTTYYEFNKPEGTDLVNPLVDTNPNWDALDADLHEFNERSIANCTEIVTLGVHAISRLDTTAKFLKWIATANFTAGETFTVDGLAVAASTPAGATLATGAYVTGSVVLACLNADNTAMTVFVSGTTVASDAERLGGQLPAYYATQSDMTTAENNISNLQSKMGNTSIVGIGDGTATGAISAINADLTANSKNFIFAYDNTTQSYGYKAGGADSFHPFKSGTLEFIDDIVASGNASSGTKLLDVGSADYRYLYIKSNNSYAMVELVNNSTIPFGFGDMNLNFRCGEVKSINDHSCTIGYSNGYYLRSSSSGTWSASNSVFVPRAVYGMK